METTAYGLLVYLIRGGVSIDQEKMVLWLNTMRMTDGGFLTTTVTGAARGRAETQLKHVKIDPNTARPESAMFCVLSLHVGIGAVQPVLSFSGIFFLYCTAG